MVAVVVHCWSVVAAAGQCSGCLEAAAAAVAAGHPVGAAGWQW